ncbi:MAG TPA: class I SAM-dependent methyltransferase [Acidobacteriota bacterium]|nr:class I SAM-dependent methyltransferase [Acidobacteriota bacterium]
MNVQDRAHPFSLRDDDISKVREAFTAAGFNEKAILDALGITSISSLKLLSKESVLPRIVGDAPLTVLLRLFVAGLPCEAKAARRVLGPLDLDRWIKGGLLHARQDRFMGAVAMIAMDDLLLAFDRIWVGQEDEPSDHVMGPSDSANFLSRLAIPRPCGHSLDLGTGSGLLALIEASQSRHVVATDVTPRAVAFARFNARLNGRTNIEVLQGDLFEPVAGRTFDRIISNPPFVISPETRLVYLTGRGRGDALCRKIASGAPALLSEGGTLQMLCSWSEPVEGEWSDDLCKWFEGSGCDVWVLRQSTRDAESYARGWMKVGTVGAAAYDPARLDTWLRYFEREGIRSVGQGFVMMRRRSGANWFRAFDGPPNLLASAGEAVINRIRALDFLAAVGSEEALMDAVFAVAPSVSLTQECSPSPEGWTQVSATLRVTEGLGYVEEVDAYIAELVAACDGRRSLREVITFVIARLGWTSSDIPTDTPALVRQLVDEGFLVPAASPEQSATG